MIEPERYQRESERLKDLESYSILDTLSEGDYDNLTSIAAQLCGTPISLISLIDSERQWFKSRRGISVEETPKEYAFCAHAIHEPKEVFMVEDTEKDIRFHDNPLVAGDPKIRFYAGAPLVSKAGMPLGTLCVIDKIPRKLTQEQIDSLFALSKQVMNLMELRKNKAILEMTMKELKEKNEELENFAHIAAHDIKSPLTSILLTAELVSTNYGPILDDEGKKLLKLMESSSYKLKRLVDGLLEYSKSGKILKEKKSTIKVETLKNDLIDFFTGDHKSHIVLNSDLKEITVNRAAIEQILINLVNNAIKYNDKEIARIEIGVVSQHTTYKFYVKDNGPGIDPENFKRIFRVFTILGQKDRFGQQGNGIGLATVKKIITALEGTISVDSEIGKGTTFVFSLNK